jgi:hypothetical protein
VWVSEMSLRKPNTLSAISLVLVLIGTYVLVFSSVSLLYKIVIVVYIFAMLFLFTLALQSLETMGKPGAEQRTPSQYISFFTGNII